jgi:hypothetical protein
MASCPTHLPHQSLTDVETLLRLLPQHPDRGGSPAARRGRGWCRRRFAACEGMGGGRGVTRGARSRRTLGSWGVSVGLIPYFLGANFEIIDVELRPFTLRAGQIRIRNISYI